MKKLNNATVPVMLSKRCSHVSIGLASHRSPQEDEVSVDVSGLRVAIVSEDGAKHGDNEESNGVEDCSETSTLPSYTECMLKTKRIYGGFLWSGPECQFVFGVLMKCWIALHQDADNTGDR